MSDTITAIDTKFFDATRWSVVKSNGDIYSRFMYKVNFDMSYADKQAVIKYYDGFDCYFSHAYGKTPITIITILFHQRRTRRYSATI